jgi:hypothetical protein
MRLRYLRTFLGCLLLLHLSLSPLEAGRLSKLALEAAVGCAAVFVLTQVFANKISPVGGVTRSSGHVCVRCDRYQEDGIQGYFHRPFHIQMQMIAAYQDEITGRRDLDRAHKYLREAMADLGTETGPIQHHFSDPSLREQELAHWELANFLVQTGQVLTQKAHFRSNPTSREIWEYLEKTILPSPDPKSLVGILFAESIRVNFPTMKTDSVVDPEKILHFIRHYLRIEDEVQKKNEASGGRASSSMTFPRTVTLKTKNLFRIDDTSEFPSQARQRDIVHSVCGVNDPVGTYP